MKFTYIYIFLQNILCLKQKSYKKLLFISYSKSRVNDGIFLSFLSIKEFFPMNFYNPCLRRKITQ